MKGQKKEGGSLRIKPGQSRRTQRMERKIVMMVASHMVDKRWKVFALERAEEGNRNCRCGVNRIHPCPPRSTP
jgi:hypothetical protein